MNNKFYRSRVDRVFGGVATGLSDYLDMDKNLIRILFIIFAILNGVGLLLYIILWIVIPEKPIEDYYNENFKTSENPDFTAQADGTASEAGVVKNKSNTRVIAGIVLIFFGLFFLSRNIFSFLDFIDLIPIIFLVVGGTFLWQSFNKK